MVGRYAEMRREMLAEELAECTFSPKVNKSSKRMAESARRPKTARGSPSISPSTQKQNLPSATQVSDMLLGYTAVSLSMRGTSLVYYQ